MTAASAVEMARLLERPWARQVAERLVTEPFRRCSGDCPAYDLADPGPWQEHHRAHHSGLRYDQLGIDGSILARLATSGLLEVARHSSTRPNEYRLADPDAVREALSLSPSLPMVGGGSTAQPELPADLLACVVGLEQQKRQIMDALLAQDPVNLLLIGPYASAKSIILAEIARLAGALLLYGPEVTWPGLRELIFSHLPRYLEVDEADKGAHRRTWQAGLYRVSETGSLQDAAYGRERTLQLRCWMVLAVNDVSQVDGALRSRCWPIRFDAYGEEERKTVIAGFLTMREGADPELAQEIATLVAPHTADVRRARDILRLCRGDRRRAAEYAAMLREDR